MDVLRMTKSAVLLLATLSLAPGLASAQTTAADPQSGTQAGTLPVSMDRIKKALKTPAPDTPLATSQQTPATDVQSTPQFSTSIAQPTIQLSSYLDDGTAVPSYVRAPINRTHYEFLDMVTPDDAKGCTRFSEKTCIGTYSQGLATALIFNQLFKQAAR